MEIPVTLAAQPAYGGMRGDALRGKRAGAPEEEAGVMPYPPWPAEPTARNKRGLVASRALLAQDAADMGMRLTASALSPRRTAAVLVVANELRAGTRRPAAPRGDVVVEYFVFPENRRLALLHAAPDQPTPRAAYRLAYYPYEPAVWLQVAADADARAGRDAWRDVRDLSGGQAPSGWPDADIDWEVDEADTGGAVRWRIVQRGNLANTGVVIAP